MPIIDLNQLPAPDVVEELDFETILAERKATLISLYPEDQQEAVARTLTLESEPLVKLLEENAYRELIWRQRVNEAARAVMLACAAGNDLDVIGANYNTTRLIITPADDSTIPPTPAVMESDTDYRLRIQQAFEGLSVAGSVGAYQYHGRSADGRVADNGNEYFKWRSRQSTTTKDLMNLKWDALYVLVNAIVNGEVISKSANGLRIAYGNYGFFIRNDGSNTYFMLTNSGDNMGTYNGLRPLWINNATGAVSMGRGLNVSGETLSDRFAINSSNGMWIQMRDNNAIFGKNIVNTDSAQALLRQNHADRKFMIGGLGNKQFGIYMINNSRTANGTDGQAYMDNNGNWLCGSQVIPGNYGNFDSRYVKDVRLGSQQYYGVNNWQTWNFQCPSGHVLSGINVQDTGSNSADNIAGVYYRPVQKYINGTWYNVASV
ncbi:hypothetical protein J5T31_001523 [Escherichia coli]|nr:hypothetical protein [Escherichia coli]